MRKIFLCLLDQEKYVVIEKHLKSLQAIEFEKFFRKEVEIIFRIAIHQASSHQPLRFLIENVPSRITKVILEKDNFEILDEFFGGYNLMVKYGESNQEELELAISKTKLLMDIHDHEINEFIKNNCGTLIEKLK